MAVNLDTTVIGFENTKEANLRSKSKLFNLYGLTYPMHENPSTGYISLISGPKIIKRNITQLLKTSPGERFMLPNYGLDIKRYLFQPLTDLLIEDLKIYIVKVIKDYAPYVEIKDLKLYTQSLSDAGFVANLTIKLFCKIKEEENSLFEVNIEV